MGKSKVHRALTLPAQSGDVLELDELWSFVQKKANTSWLWIGRAGARLEVVAYVVGGRGADACEKLKKNILPAYDDSSAARCKYISR